MRNDIALRDFDYVIHGATGAAKIRGAAKSTTPPRRNIQGGWSSGITTRGYHRPSTRGGQPTTTGGR